MATALAATFQPGTGSAPASVLLQVTGAPSLTPNYSSNFTATVDGWTGTAGSFLLPGSGGGNRMELQSEVTGLQTSTFSRTVTGLTVGWGYVFTAMTSSNIPGGSIALNVSGKTASAFVGAASRVAVSYAFTATATSHVIQFLVKPPKPVPYAINGSFFIDTVKVITTTGWQGTTIRRTDANGTNVVVRESPGGQDTTGTTGSATMTVTDYEAALTGTVQYVVTDGAGGTASASAVRSITATRTNTMINPTLTTNTTGWTHTVAAAGTATPTRETTGGPTIEGATRNFYRQTWATVTTGTVGSTGILFGTSASDTMTITPGVPNTISVYVRSSVPTRTVQLTITSHKSDGTGSFTEVSGNLFPVGDGWFRCAATFTPGAGQVRAFTRIYNNGGPIHVVGDTLDATAAQCETTATVGTFFDGATPGDTVTGNRWTGTAGASTSEQGPYAPPNVWLTIPATADPGTPTPPRFVRAQLVTDYAETSESNGSAHVIINRADPIVNAGPLGLRSGSVRIWCADYAEAKAVRTLLANGDVALLRQPSFPGMDIYLVSTGVDIQPAELTVTQRWVCTVEWVEVLAP